MHRREPRTQYEHAGVLIYWDDDSSVPDYQISTRSPGARYIASPGLTPKAS